MASLSSPTLHPFHRNRSTSDGLLKIYANAAFPSVNCGSGILRGSFSQCRFSTFTHDQKDDRFCFACLISCNVSSDVAANEHFEIQRGSYDSDAKAAPKHETDRSSQLCIGDHGSDGGGDGDGNSSNGNGRGSNDDSHRNNNEEDDHNSRHDNGDHEEFGTLLSFEEVSREAMSRGVKLPVDMAEAARTVGIRTIVLARFMDLQASAWPLGAAIRSIRMLRNRMLADQSFLFKLFTEIAIDSGCATFAELQKRGDDFWNEFELYLADVIVGVVVDAALVGMLAPYIQFGKASPSTGIVGHLSRSIQALPSSVFEAATPDRRFTLQQRIVSYFYKGVQYGAVGFSCGLIGQGIANSIMVLKRRLHKSENKDVPVPPLVKSAALWGVFLAVSSNTRYQIINGLERVVEGSPLGRKLPFVAMTFTVCIRFANNTYGGMQFVDWARWSGVQ